MLFIESNDECMEYLPKEYRYIQCYLNWSNKNQNSHFVELEAYVWTTNVARNKTVTICKWTIDPGSPKQPSAFTDWDKTSNNYVDLAANISWWWGGLQVDLWQKYKLNYIKIRHYYSDSRIYSWNVVLASRDWIKRYTLFDSSVDWTYSESSSWKTINIQ